MYGSRYRPGGGRGDGDGDERGKAAEATRLYITGSGRRGWDGKISRAKMIDGNRTADRRSLAKRGKGRTARQKENIWRLERSGAAGKGPACCRVVLPPLFCRRPGRDIFGGPRRSCGSCGRTVVSERVRGPGIFSYYHKDISCVVLPRE